MAILKINLSKAQCSINIAHHFSQFFSQKQHWPQQHEWETLPHPALFTVHEPSCFLSLGTDAALRSLFLWVLVSRTSTAEPNSDPRGIRLVLNPVMPVPGTGTLFPSRNKCIPHSGKIIVYSWDKRGPFIDVICESLDLKSSGSLLTQHLGSAHIFSRHSILPQFLQHLPQSVQAGFLCASVLIPS